MRILELDAELRAADQEIAPPDGETELWSDYQGHLLALFESGELEIPTSFVEWWREAYRLAEAHPGQSSSQIFEKLRAQGLESSAIAE